METFGALLLYLSGSAMILLLSLLWVTALLEIRSQRHKGVFSPTVLVFMAIAISVLAICLILVADAVFIDNRSGAHSPWSDWGFRLGSWVPTPAPTLQGRPVYCAVQAGREKKGVRVADVTYVSRVRIEPAEGKVRRAYLPVQEEPVLFGVHSEVAEHYGVSHEVEEPYDTTLDYLVAATGGWLLGTFRGALAARQVSFDDLYADTVGEVETEGKVLVVKRIRQVFHLTADEKDRDTIERVLGVYADYCPVARSIKGSIEISSELEFNSPRVSHQKSLWGALP
jgi:uncharacterized OsmC-like protein